MRRATVTRWMDDELASVLRRPILETSQEALRSEAPSTTRYVTLISSSAADSIGSALNFHLELLPSTRRGNTITVRAAIHFYLLCLK